MSEENKTNRYEIVEMYYPQMGYVDLDAHVLVEIEVVQRAIATPSVLSLVVPLLMSYDAKHMVIQWMKEQEGNEVLVKKLLPILLPKQLNYQDHLLLLEMALNLESSMDLAFDTIVTEIGKLQDEINELKENMEEYEDAESALHDLETYYLSLMSYLKVYLEYSPPIQVSAELLLHVANDPSVSDDLQKIAVEHPSYKKR